MPEGIMRQGQIPETGRINAGILGLGSYVPKTVVSNEDLAAVLDTSDDWITRRTGIKTRRFATPEESLPVMLSMAAIEALRNARLEPEDIGLVIAAHNSTDTTSTPPVSTRVQYLTGATNAFCADIEGGCSGVTIAAKFALAQIRHDYHYAKKRDLKVLLVGGDVMTNRTPMGDRASAVVLSDGGGAMVLGPEYDPELGIRHAINKADGSRGHLIHYGLRPYNQLAGTHPLRFDKPTGGAHEPFKMNGREVHRFIGTKAPELVRDLLVENGWELSDLKQFLVVPHQMNLVSIDLAKRKLIDKLGYEPREIYTDGVVNDGNNSTASIPIGLHRIHQQGKLELYDPFMGIAFGSGLTWGGFIGTWNEPQTLLEYTPHERQKMFEEVVGRYAQFQAQVEKLRSS